MGSVPARLAEFIQRNSYVRVPNTKRRRKEKTRYKKGWELRIVLKDEAEVKEARRLLKTAGIRPAKPFAKARQWVQPVYGKAAMEMAGKRASPRRAKKAR